MVVPEEPSAAERARAAQLLGATARVEILVFEGQRDWLDRSLPAAQRLAGWIERARGGP